MKCSEIWRLIWKLVQILRWFEINFTNFSPLVSTCYCLHYNLGRMIVYAKSRILSRFELRSISITHLKVFWLFIFEWDKYFSNTQDWNEKYARLVVWIRKSETNCMFTCSFLKHSFKFETVINILSKQNIILIDGKSDCSTRFIWF